MEKASLSIAKTFAPFAILFLFFLFSLNPWIDRMALPGYASYDIKRIAELFALLTINSYLVFSTTYRRYSYSIYSKLSRSTRLSLVGLFYLGIISSLLAPLTHWALLEVMLDTQLFYLVIFIAIHNLIWKKTSDYLLIAIILISALIYTITFFVAFMQQHANPSATYYEFPGFMNLRFFAQYQIGTIPIITLPILIMHNKHKIYAALSYGLATIWFTLAILDGSRGLWLSLILSILLTRTIFKRHLSQWLWIQIKALMGAILFFLFILGMIVFSHDYNLSEKFYPLYNSLSDHYTFHALIGSASARIQLAKTAIQLALNNPLFGVGPLHFSYYDPGDIAAHPHNSILLIASEWGIPAALCVSMLLVNGFTQWIKMQKNKMLKQTDKQTISMILTVSLIAELIYSLMSGVTITPLSQIVFVLILGWMLGLYHRSDKKIIESTNIHCYLFSLTIMISTLLLLSLSIVVTHNLPQKEIQWYFQQQTGQKHFYPRFWVQGELR